MTAFKETPEYRAYLAIRDIDLPPGVTHSSEFSRLAEVAMEAAYNLGLTKIESPRDGFKCPECGGYKFGTSDCSKPIAEWIGECHGGDHWDGCGFEWSRSDDIKYGLEE